MHFECFSCWTLVPLLVFFWGKRFMMAGTTARLNNYVVHPLVIAVRACFIAVSCVFLAGITLKLLFTFFPWTVCYMLYLNHFSWPPKYFINFTNLSFHNLEGENIYLRANNETLGVWRIPPENFPQETSPLPVVMYVHGNAGSRATHGRVGLYKNLGRLGFTVITFDYRGYGDSSGTPWGEQDLVADGFAVYEWTRKEYPDKEIFVWGHSLGTGVSTHLVQYIENRNITVDGLVLDSPFSDLDDAMRRHPLLGPLHMVPGFTDSVASAMQKMQINLNNSAAVLTLNTPLLILHSEDDKVIPVELGRKLYANVKHRVPPVSLVTFAAELGYGHKGIYKDPEIPRIVNDFFEACRRHKGLTKEITIGKDMKSEHTTDV